MSANTLSELEFDESTAKRAAWEAFEFSLEAPGLVRVRNGSHADPSEHEYLVDVDDGVPRACECKAFQYHDGACKHLVAVAIRAPVLSAATPGVEREETPLHGSESEQIRADGGVSADESGSGESPDPDDVCADECDECTDDLPCWDCVDSGRRSLPDE